MDNGETVQSETGEGNSGITRCHYCGEEYSKDEDHYCSHDVAVYECWCGRQVEIREKNFTNVRWAASKFGFKNIDEFIGHNRDCCDRPEYTSTVTRKKFR